MKKGKGFAKWLKNFNNLTVKSKLKNQFYSGIIALGVIKDKMVKKKRKVFDIARYILLVLFVSSIIALSLHKGWVIYKTNHWVDDDAFISFRYAENWANGKGLVYNEGERVEGYTNFLRTLIIDLFIKVGVSPLWSSLIISLILSLLTVFFLFKLSYATSKTKTWMDGIPTLLLVSSGIG
ncbi:hypothetical protein KKG61_01545 [bacterium]|nr:hypothetical protein [bacterium]